MMPEANASSDRRYAHGNGWQVFLGNYFSAPLCPAQLVMGQILWRGLLHLDAHL